MPSVLQINLTHNSYVSLARNSAGPDLELTAFQWHKCENISQCCHGKRNPKETLVANSWTNDCIQPFWNLPKNLLQWDEFIPMRATTFNISSQIRCFHRQNLGKSSQPETGWDVSTSWGHRLHKCNTSPNACWVLFLKASSFLVSPENKLILGLFDQWGSFEFSWRLYVYQPRKSAPLLWPFLNPWI